MNKPNDGQILTKRGWQCWFCIRKAQIAGFIFGALFTIGILVLCDAIRPRLGSILAYVAEAVMMPAEVIASKFGVPAHWFVNDSTGNFAFWPLCLIIITNAVLGFVCGTFVGALLKYAWKNK